MLIMEYMNLGDLQGLLRDSAPTAGRVRPLSSFLLCLALPRLASPYLAPIWPCLASCPPRRLLCCVPCTSYQMCPSTVA